MKMVATLFFMLLLSPPSWGADFEKGLKALEREDYSEALEELMPLAERKDPDAQYNVAVIHDVTDNEQEAVRWYILAAEQGHPEAQTSLAFRYKHGVGVEKNSKKALTLFQLAASAGNGRAQYILGTMYQGWPGVIQDYQKAFKFYLMSAEQGHAAAQFALAVMYSNGMGVPKDNVYAHMWVNISASLWGGQQAQDARSKLTSMMTPDQIAEAQRLARECVAREYKGC